MARGGKNYPARPAAVSGPSSGSARTDGGAGSDSQPLRAATGGDYGERQATLDQQRAAPLATQDQGGGTPRPALGGASSLLPDGGVFGATERPGESPMTGSGTRANAVATDVDSFLRALYSNFPHPAIASLIRTEDS